MGLLKVSCSLKIPSKVRAVHSSMIAGLFVTFVIFSVPGSAAAQDIRDDIKESLDRKYDILQQQANTERLRAETERKQVERATEAQSTQFLSASNTRSASQIYYVPLGDALSGTNAATYQLINGVILRASGDFRPDAPGRCIAYCR